MNKTNAILLLFLTVLLFSNVKLEARADNFSSNNIGVSLDYNEYGEHKSKIETSRNHYYEHDGVQYKVGYSELYAAVYESKSDTSYNLVLARSLAEGYTVSIKTGYFWTKTFDGDVANQKMTSDIDNSYKSVYQGAYYSSTGFNLLQYSPQDQPTTDEVTVSITAAPESVSVSASYTIELNEVFTSFDHSIGDERFSVRQSYSNGSYRTSVTELIGMYTIQRGSSYHGTIGKFVNAIRIDTVMTDDDGNFPVNTADTDYYTGYLYY